MLPPEPQGSRGWHEKRKPHTLNPKQESGTVNSWNVERQFGFISCDGNRAHLISFAVVLGYSFSGRSLGTPKHGRIPGGAPLRFPSDSLRGSSSEGVCSTTGPLGNYMKMHSSGLFRVCGL